MARIFLSHASADHWRALAIRQWLTENGWDDVFLDVDPQRGLVAGERWQEALRRAADQCEAVIFLVSPDWARSKWCLAEFLLAKSLHKLIFGAIIDEVPGADLPAELTSEWQLCRLVPDGPTEKLSVLHNGHVATVTFSSGGLARLKAGLKLAGLSADYFPWPPPHDEHRSPYRGLEPVDVHDAAVFFGRDSEILHGLDELRGVRATTGGGAFIILGPSGAGKSSFLRAGLLSRLVRDDRHFFPLAAIRPERSPLFGEAGLARAIADANARLSLSPSGIGDVKTAIRAAPDGALQLIHAIHDRLTSRSGDSDTIVAPPTVILAIDQAEQLFDAGISDESHAFLQLIGDLLRQDASTKSPEAMSRFIAVFTIRSDRYEPLQTAPELTGVHNILFDRLRPMSPAQFKEVIVGPALRGAERGRALTFEPDLVNTLLAESAKGADTLPLLSLTLRKLYEDYGGHGTIRLEHYRAMGGLSDIIQKEIAQVLPSNPNRRAEQLDILRTIFLPWLATVSADDEPIARVARDSELPTAGRELVDALVGRHLLLRDLRGSDRIVQVAHESLLRHWDTLKRWLREDAEELKEIERLEQASAGWIRSGRKASWLITGERLTSAQSLARNPKYGARLRTTTEFIAASHARERHGRIGQWVSAAVALIIAGVVLWLFGLREPDARPPLRSTAATIAESDLATLIKERDFFERTRNPGGKPYPHSYRTIQSDGTRIVIDEASQLVWVLEGSSEALNIEQIPSYLDKVNSQLLSGFGDWRLPTVEEAMSLMEVAPRADRMYVDRVFGSQPRIWTSDRVGKGELWTVNFRDATVGVGSTDFSDVGKAFVRPVRSGAELFSQIDLSSIGNEPWEETGLGFHEEAVKPPRGMTRRGVPFRLLGGGNAVFITQATLKEQRPTEARLDLDVPEPASAHVLIAAGWLTEVFKNEKVGEIEYHLDDRVVRTDLVGWKTVREGWNAYGEPLEPVESGSVVLIDFFKEPQLRSLTSDGDPARGLGVIDMLSTDFGSAGAGARLRRIVLRDTSKPKQWLDPRTHSYVLVDPGIAFMGITVRSRLPQ